MYFPLIKKDHKFSADVVERRYKFLKLKLSKLQEAKAYIEDSKQLIESGLAEVSELRIESRNKDIFKRDNFLGSMSSWQKGASEIKQHIDTYKVVPLLVSLILAFIIYNICLYFLNINIGIVKRYLSVYRDRKLINKISIFMRIFWCIFVPSLLTLGLLKFLSASFGWSEVNYIVLIYFHYSHMYKT